MQQKKRMSKKVNITLPKPYDAQIPVVKSCLKSDDKFIILNGSRQVGKTFLLAIIAIYWAQSEPGQHIMIVSPTDSQVKKIYKQILSLIEPAAEYLIKSSKAQTGDAEVVFNNKSVIIFRSAASENSLRGYSNTHLLLDEAAFIKEDTWTTILAPTLSVRGRKCLICSTPKGKNFFAKMYSLGLNLEKGYKSYKITYHQNPYANLEFIMQQKQVLPDDIFAQEYLGEFVDATGIFKYVDEVSTLHRVSGPVYGKSYSIGVDIAFKTDYTVAVCLDDSGNMVDYIRFNQVDTHTMQTKLKEFFSKWNPRKIVIEENNQGIPVIDGLQRMGVTNIERFQTNARSKNELINKFMSAFNNRELHLINEDVIKEEFKAFTYSLTANGNITFSAAYGHDDIVMASAFAYQGIIDMRWSKPVFM
jgi:phage FluMu gp28-like protein